MNNSFLKEAQKNLLQTKQEIVELIKIADSATLRLILNSIDNSLSKINLILQ